MDALSDLDIELIGPGRAGLVGDDDGPGTIADVLVSIHLGNEAPEEPDWPTCLVVFADGRKVDFALAGTERIERMSGDGLDCLYQRGYIVRLDATGLTRELPSRRWSRRSSRSQIPRKFARNQREFWFEATQIPIYLARGMTAAVDGLSRNASWAERARPLCWRAGRASARHGGGDRVCVGEPLIEIEHA